MPNKLKITIYLHSPVNVAAYESFEINKIGYYFPPFCFCTLKRGCWRHGRNNARRENQIKKYGTNSSIKLQINCYLRSLRKFGQYWLIYILIHNQLMVEPHHYLSSEEKNIDHKLFRTSKSSNQVKSDRVDTRSGELVVNANQCKQKVEVFAVKIMSVRGRALRGNVV